MFGTQQVVVFLLKQTKIIFGQLLFATILFSCDGAIDKVDVDQSAKGQNEESPIKTDHSIIERTQKKDPRFELNRASSSLPDKGIEREPGRLLIFKKVPSGAIPLPKNAVVKQSDRIQMVLHVSAWPYESILSVDGRGVVTQHYPEMNDYRKKTKKAGETLVLPFSFKLDDAPKYERFFLLGSNQPIVQLQIASILRDMTKKNISLPNLPSSVKIVDEFLLIKK